MADDESLEDLFTQFDDVVEAGEKPSPPPSTTLTHSRAPSLWTRFVRWTVQGSGPLVAYVALFLVAVGRHFEMVGDALGLCLVVFVAAPLLGQRPLAQGRRWALVAGLATLLAACLATLVRWPSLLMEGAEAPLASLVLAGCSVVETATSPLTLLWCLLTGTALFWLGRRLASANPWVETRPGGRAWRRTASLALGGLFLGVTLSLPLLHYVLWQQSWMLQAQTPAPKVARESAPNDLISLILSEPTASVQDIESTIKSWDRKTLLSQAAKTTAYLTENRALTSHDLTALEGMLARCSRDDEDPNGVLGEFAWQAYRRALRGELGRGPSFLAGAALRKQALSTLSASSGANVALWQQRALEMTNPRTVTREEIDGVFLRKLAVHTPGYTMLSHAKYEQPLRLFGLNSRWSPRALALEAERTWALLLYSHRRQSLTSPRGFSLGLHSPYSGMLFFDLPVQKLMGKVVGDLPYQGFSYDKQLLEAILELNAIKAATGAYPTAYPKLPDGFSYQGGGATAHIIGGRTSDGDFLLRFKADLK